MDNTELNKIDAKIQALNERKKAIKAREASQKRKEDTRKKILIGGAIMAAVKSNKMQWQTVKSLLDESLTRDHDRALFDLPEKPNSDLNNG